MSRLHIGTSGWNYNHWKDIFYPKGLQADKWLAHYAKYFDTVEVNNSFYHLPEKSTFEHWREGSPPDFIFAVKASRYLTHMKKLKDAQEPLDLLLSRADDLGDRLGPILYQLPPYWHANLERLEEFLKILPPDLRHVFEFRDDTWQTEDVWSMLERYNAGYCIMDSPGLPTHIRTTADYSYIRMHGGYGENGNYSEDEIAEWADSIGNLRASGDVYVYYNNDSHGNAVRNALSLKDLLK